jgi:hypothetical protein
VLVRTSSRFMEYSHKVLARYCVKTEFIICHQKAIINTQQLHNSTSAASLYSFHFLQQTCDSCGGNGYRNTGQIWDTDFLITETGWYYSTFLLGIAVIRI